MRVKNLRILRFKKFLGCCFYMEPSIQWNFKICISIPFKNPIKPVTEYLSRTFQDIQITKTGLLDFHKMVATVLKMFIKS